MKRTWVVVTLAALMFVGGCRSCQGQTVERKLVYDAVLNDIDVIQGDLRIRAETKAVAAYTDAVSRLAVQTEVARNLLAKKAEAEKPDYETYNNWISQLNTAHDTKLIELGRERDEFLRLHRQRYETLAKDAEAIRALKDHERRKLEECRRSGLLGWLRQITGNNQNVVSGVDIGKPIQLGTLGSVMLP